MARRIKIFIYLFFNLRTLPLSAFFIPLVVSASDLSDDNALKSKYLRGVFVTKNGHIRMADIEQLSENGWLLDDPASWKQLFKGINCTVYGRHKFSIVFRNSWRTPTKIRLFFNLRLCYYLDIWSVFRQKPSKRHQRVARTKPEDAFISN